jgi:hypothetical protein
MPAPRYMPAMRSNETIQNCIDHGYTITAWCPNNHHSALDLIALRDRLGPDHSAMRAALLPLLRCATCQEKATSIICSPAMMPGGIPVKPQ